MSFLIYFYQHQESRTLGRIAPIMPEVLRWSKIALKEDHEQMINVTFGILSWVGIAAPVEFKDSLAEFVDIMLVSEKCQDLYCKFSETGLKRPVKNRQNKILMTSGSLMKVESIAECSPWSILQYF